MLQTMSQAVTFEDIQNEKAVVIDFWADWCGPCQTMSPIFEELSSEIDNVKFMKVNVDQAENFALALGVQSIPTFVLFVDGEERSRKVGSITKEELRAWMRGNF